MRVGIVVVGVVLVIIGAVLLFVPLSPQANQDISTSSSVPIVELSVSGFSITGSIPVAISWTSTSAVTVVAAACTSGCTNVSSVSGATLQTGTSGSFTLNQPNGGEIVIGALNTSGSPSTVTFKLTTALSTVGTALLIVGIIVLIIGAVLKSKKAKMAPTAPAAPMSTMGAPPAPMYTPPDTPGTPPAQPPMGST